HRLRHLGGLHYLGRVARFELGGGNDVKLLQLAPSQNQLPLARVRGRPDNNRGQADKTHSNDSEGFCREGGTSDLHCSAHTLQLRHRDSTAGSLHILDDSKKASFACPLDNWPSMPVASWSRRYHLNFRLWFPGEDQRSLYLAWDAI